MSKEKIDEFDKSNILTIISLYGKKVLSELEVKIWLKKAIQKEKQALAREILKEIDDYFEGLVHIPFPELTKDKIKKNLTEVAKKNNINL